MDEIAGNHLVGRAGTEWSDRILGRSEIVGGPLAVTWAASGNNVIVQADTVRRILGIELETMEEHPEQRDKFLHPDLLGWLRQERGRLYMAALTILAAYIRDGKSDQGLKPWGSYEGWSALVRSAVVWLGLTDPREGYSESVKLADADAAAVGAILELWPTVDPNGEGVTLGTVLAAVDADPTAHRELSEAIRQFCPGSGGKLPEAKRLGDRLRRFQRRNIGGRYFDTRPGRVAKWAAVVADSSDSITIESAAGGRSGGGGAADSSDSSDFSKALRGCDPLTHTQPIQEGARKSPSSPTSPQRPAEPTGYIAPDLDAADVAALTWLDSADASPYREQR